LFVLLSKSKLFEVRYINFVIKMTVSDGSRSFHIFTTFLFGKMMSLFVHDFDFFV